MSSTERSDPNGPLVVTDVLVPLSSSPASEAAIAPGAELANRFGARLSLVTVGIEQAEAEAMARRVARLSETVPAVLDTYVDWDVPKGILAVAAEHPAPLVCMASAAHGRIGEALLGSYATEVVAETPDPVILVGPDLDPRRGLGHGPVYACVDGSAGAEQVLPVAARWAAALGTGLRVVTVAEPTGAGLDDRPVHRTIGPDGDPQAYVDGLAEAWKGAGTDVAGLVIWDPIGPAQGLATWLEDHLCGLVAVTTHARTGLRRAVFGSHSTSILRHSPVPVLVVPPAFA